MSEKEIARVQAFCVRVDIILNYETEGNYSGIIRCLNIISWGGDSWKGWGTKKGIEITFKED